MKRVGTEANLMFRAFSDGTRLRILRLLLGGELCVGDIVAAIQVPQPTASRHLAYLRKAGLVQTRKNGLWNYYRLAPAANQVSAGSDPVSSELLSGRARTCGR